MPRIEVPKDLENFFSKKGSPHEKAIEIDPEAKLAGSTGAKKATINEQSVIVKDANLHLSSDFTNQEYINKLGVLREYLVAPLFERMLYKTTPSIIKIRSDSFDLDRTSPRIAGTFVEDARPLSDWIDKPIVKHIADIDPYEAKDHELVVCKDRENPGKLHWKRGDSAGMIDAPKYYDSHSALESNRPQRKTLDNLIFSNTDVQNHYLQELKKIQGMEKLILSCLAFGDGDFHSENILVKDNKLFKIDNGKSTLVWHKNDKEVLTHISDLFDEYHYLNKIPFKAEKLVEAIESLGTINAEEYSTILNSRLYDFSKAGFVFPASSKNEQFAYNFIVEKTLPEELVPGQIAVTLNENDQLVCKAHDKDPIIITNIEQGHDYITMIKAGEYSKLSDRLTRDAESGIKYDILKSKLTELGSHKSERVDELKEKIAEAEQEGVNDILKFACYPQGNNRHPYIDTENQHRCKLFGDSLLNKMLKQKELLQNLRETFEVISKIDFDPKQGDISHEEWKNGGWLAKIGSQDPIIWAKNNKFTIEGQDPIEWAKEKKVSIQGRSSEEWEEGRSSRASSFSDDGLFSDSEEESTAKTSTAKSRTRSSSFSFSDNEEEKPRFKPSINEVNPPTRAGGGRGGSSR